MKKVFLVVTLASFIFACQDSRDTAVQEIPKHYSKTTGEQIPMDVAQRWVKNFGGTISAGRERSLFSIDAEHLSQVLTSNTGPGVVLHHATDDNAVHHILMFTLGPNGDLFQSMIFDLPTGETLSTETAQAWAQNYRNEHPATPWYHFFGSDIFAEIQSNPAFDYVNVIRALNDEGEEQVLLFVYSTANVSGGRSEGQEVTVYDLSNPCPPCAAN